MRLTGGTPCSEKTGFIERPPPDAVSSVEQNKTSLSIFGPQRSHRSFPYLHRRQKRWRLRRLRKLRRVGLMRMRWVGPSSNKHLATLQNWRIRRLVNLQTVKGVGDLMLVSNLAGRRAGVEVGRWPSARSDPCEAGASRCLVPMMVGLESKTRWVSLGRGG